MDSFEPWQAYTPSFMEQLDRSVAHVVAYALATDCFQQLQPLSERDVAIHAACQIDDGAVFSEQMSMADLCNFWAVSDQRDTEREEFCP